MGLGRAAFFGIAVLDLIGGAGCGFILRAMEMARAVALLCAVVVLSVPGSAQENSPWQMQSSGTTAGLRGIDSVDGRVAWASGTGGTVLRTTDAGAHWEKCSVPDAAKDGATLDLRGVQGFDAQTAVVMASGPGAQSRLYKTTDGCTSWRLLFANPDAPAGFFDSFWMNGPKGMVLGDPVRGKFTVFLTEDKGKKWERDRHAGLALAGRSLAAFAASNTSIARGNELFTRGFATGGVGGSFFFNRPFTAEEEREGIIDKLVQQKGPGWKSSKIPVGEGTESSGAFSVAYRYPVTIGVCAECTFNDNSRFVAVGGDYKNPADSAHTAAYSSDGGWTWTEAVALPHGFRSAVEWSDVLKAWIAVGTNGSDISRDDGKTWKPLDDGKWNAVSLPFVVGPEGRIGKLEPLRVIRGQ